MTVRVPPIEEQRLIGATLRSADEEVAKLKAMAAALHEEKKALMQQLLAGKRHVNLDTAKPAEALD